MGEAATLIVGPSWVGDMVMAQSLFKLLKQRQPTKPLDVVAPGWSLPIVARMPEIRHGIAVDTAHGEIGLSKRWRLGRKLREDDYDRAIVLPRSLKAALVPWFGKIETRTGFRGEHRYGLINDMRPFDRTLLDQTVKRFVALGLSRDEVLPAVPHPSLSVSKENQKRAMDKLGLRSGSPVIAIMPGAEYGPAKCWPLEYFAELVSMLSKDGYQSWVLGSEKDRLAGEAIEASGAINLCGRTTLEDVIDLLGYAQQAVSNDSGLMHIAAAVGIHVHGLYGSSSPDFTPPLTENRDIHYLGIDCSPCFKRVCPLEHLRCLRDLKSADVYATIRQYD